jgi:hypothetical protein
MKQYASLNYSPEQNKIHMHNEYGIMCQVAMSSESGRWMSDCSELKETVFSALSDELQESLNERLNSEQLSNSELNTILNNLRNKYMI